MRSDRYNTQENNAKHAKKPLYLSLLSFALSICVLVSLGGFATYAWYQYNKNSDIFVNEVSSAQGVSADKMVGHDTYKYNINEGKGELISGETVSMNAYDTIFDTNNKYTPIIMRAVVTGISGQEFSLYITSEAISTAKSSPAFQQEPFNGNILKADKDGKLQVPSTINGGYIQNFLSNVVNVRAAYIQGLATDASEGNFDHDLYADADDYIYQTAKAYFEENAASIAEVNFIQQSEGTPAKTVHDVSYRVEKVNSTNNLAAGTGEVVVGYFISDTNGTNFLTVNGSNAIANGTLGNAISSVGTVALDSNLEADPNLSNYVETAISNLSGKLNPSTGNLKQYLWIGNNNRQLSGTSSVQNLASERYLNRSSNTAVNAATSTRNWTIDTSNSNLRFYYYNNGNRYLRYNGTWNTINNSNYVSVYKVVLSKSSHTTEPVPGSYDNIIKIDVDVNAASEPGLSELYYVYLMIDYDLDLIKLYETQNDVTFAIGQVGAPFEDRFNISASE